jgi:hypothetical protein
MARLVTQSPRHRTVAAVVVWLVGLWGMLVWTMIPVGFDGRVVDIGWQSDSGLRYRTIELDTGDTVLATRGLVRRIGPEEELPGKQLDKRAWDRAVRVDGRQFALSLFDETVRPALALTALLLVGLARSSRTRRVSDA